MLHGNIPAKRQDESNLTFKGLMVYCPAQKTYLFYFYFFGGKTQGLVDARQAHYHLATSSAPRKCRCYQIAGFLILITPESILIQWTTLKRVSSIKIRMLKVFFFSYYYKTTRICGTLLCTKRIRKVQCTLLMLHVWKNAYTGLSYMGLCVVLWYWD